MRVGSHFVEPRKLAFFAAEQLFLLIAFAGTSMVVGRALGVASDWPTALGEGVAATLIVQVGLYLADLYNFRIAWEDAPHAARLLRALGAATIACGLLTLLVPGPLAARAAAVAGLGGACTAAVALRGALPDLGRKVSLRARVLLVGQGQAARKLLKEIENDGHFEVVGSARIDTMELAACARALRADGVVVALDDQRGLNVRELLACRLAGLEVVHVAQFAERALKQVPVELTRPSDLVFSDGFQRPAWLLFARRIVSLLAALLLFLVAAPLLLVTAIAIRLESRGSILYRQARMGMHGQTFSMLKFRTMHVDAESSGARWALKDDPRITRVGRHLRRFRIDELPQLINVIRGEMNLVGPRPERPEFVALLREKIPYYDLRSLVPPGITGWAQIRFPYAASLEEAQKKLHYDLYYVKHLSLMLDLIILFHTAKVVLFGRGAR